MDEAAILDTIQAINRTLCVLRNSGVGNRTIIGVLAGLTSNAIKTESPEYQIAIRTVLVEKFGGPA